MNHQESTVGDNVVNPTVTQTSQIIKQVTGLIGTMNFMSDSLGSVVELKYLEDLIVLENFEIVQSIEEGLVGHGIGEGFTNKKYQRW